MLARNLGNVMRILAMSKAVEPGWPTGLRKKPTPLRASTACHIVLLREADHGSLAGAFGHWRVRWAVKGDEGTWRKLMENRRLWRTLSRGTALLGMTVAAAASMATSAQPSMRQRQQQPMQRSYRSRMRRRVRAEPEARRLDGDGAAYLLFNDWLHRRLWPNGRADPWPEQYLIWHD
jgi:hypothetical protein